MRIKNHNAAGARCLYKTAACLLLLLLAAMPAAAQDEFRAITEQYEPMPGREPTLHESSPFTPIELDPVVLMDGISRTGNEQAAVDLIASLGIPMDTEDAAALYHSKLNRHTVSVSTLYLRGAPYVLEVDHYGDGAVNTAFIFVQALEGERAGAWYLLDCIVNFTYSNIVRSTDGQALWMIGASSDAGDEPGSTVRWYNLATRSVDLKYLSYGIRTTGQGSTVYVVSGTNVEQSELADDGLVVVCKYVSLEMDAQEAEAWGSEPADAYCRIELYGTAMDADGNMRLARIGQHFVDGALSGSLDDIPASDWLEEDPESPTP